MSTQVSNYDYDPSLGAAIVAASLYTAVFIGTTVQWLRYRSWVWIVMMIVAAMESIGYISRCLSTQNLENKTFYVIQYALIMLAPVLMTGACYVARIVFHVVPKEARSARLLWVSPRWLTPIFVVCDVLALITQLGGAVMITSVSAGDADAKSKANRGKSITELGVATQLICFGLFSIIAVRFNFTSKRFKISFDERSNSNQGKFFSIEGGNRTLETNWQTILRVTNFASVCILIRSAYRMVDFALGRTGYTETHEWCSYIFDALVNFPVLALFVWYHPARYLPYFGFRLLKDAR